MEKRRLLLHPFLFALYPVTAIFVSNIEQVSPRFALRPLLFSLLSGLVVLILTKLFIRDWDQAGLITSLFLVLFFSYGHVYGMVEGARIAGLVIGRHRIILLVWGVVMFLGSWWIWKKLASPRMVTRTVNLIAIVALVLPVLRVSSFYFRQAVISPTLLEERSVGFEQEGKTSEWENFPDIYYIILDAYARQDVLEAIYQYDNSALLGNLEARGFFIARESRSNYGQTTLSLSSSLNMNYLDTFISSLDTKGDDLSEVILYLKHSQVRNLLEAMGYTTIALESGYLPTEIEDADIYLKPTENSSDNQGNLLGSLTRIGTVNPFEVMVVQSSAAILFTDYAAKCVAELDANVTSSSQDEDHGNVSLGNWLARPCVLFESLSSSLKYPFKEHRERIQFELDKLSHVPVTGKERFVFAHILAPHLPFVFGSDGKVGQNLEDTGLPFWDYTGTRQEYLDGYVDQIAYIDMRILEIVDAILFNAKTEPVIILQADHGPDANSVGNVPLPLPFLSERFPILNAYYLPLGCEQDQFYASITPVNAFRVIFNACFGSDYELLDDRSYWSLYDHPFDFVDVTDEIDQ